VNETAFFSQFLLYIDGIQQDLDNLEEYRERLAKRGRAYRREFDHYAQSMKEIKRRVPRARFQCHLIVCASQYSRVLTKWIDAGKRIKRILAGLKALDEILEACDNNDDADE
jgi:hypothetical protein